MDYETLKRSLGRIVRAERAKRDHSQESFAHLADVHRTYLGDVERGVRNPSLQNLFRIATALNMPLSKLLAEAEDLAETQNK